MSSRIDPRDPTVPDDLTPTPSPEAAPDAAEAPRLPPHWGQVRPRFKNRILAGLIFIVPLGITGLVRPVAGSLSYLWVDLAVMSGFGVLALVLMTRGRTLRRGEGAVMVALYLAYLAWLIL